MRNFTLALIVLCPALSWAASTLTIYNIPSPKKYNWSTPVDAYQSLKANISPKLPKKDIAGNKIKGLHHHSLGHAYIALSCQRPDGTKREILNGMTMRGFPRDFMGEFHWLGGRGKYGFSMLFYTFKGRFNVRSDRNEEKDRKALLRDLNKRRELAPYRMFDDNTRSFENRSLLSFIRYEINDQTCEDLAKYYDDFQHHGGDLQYGFMVHPLNEHNELNVGPHLGSGCSEFVVSFLKRAGLLRELEAQTWQRTLVIPNSLIGTPTHPVRRSFLSGNTLPWGQANAQNTTTLTFWDPELMHDWALRKHESREAGITPVFEQNAKGVLIKAN